MTIEIDNDIIDNLSLVIDLYGAGVDLTNNALDYHPSKSKGYIDVRKEDFDALFAAIENMEAYIYTEVANGNDV